jgi:hypothetical protein
VSGTQRKPLTESERDELGRLKAKLEIAEGELEELQQEAHGLRNRVQGSIPLEDVHIYLDGLGAPRLNADGKKLLVRNRFQWVRAAIYGRD